MLTDKEKEIALECIEKVDSEGWDFGVHRELVQFDDLFLSRIREGQEAIAWIDEYNGLIRKKPIPIAGITGTVFKPLFTTPPAAPDCSELVEALARITELNSWEAIHTIAYQALANHAKRTRGEE